MKILELKSVFDMRTFEKRPDTGHWSMCWWRESTRFYEFQALVGRKRGRSLLFDRIRTFPGCNTSSLFLQSYVGNWRAWKDRWFTFGARLPAVPIFGALQWVSVIHKFSAQSPRLSLSTDKLMAAFKGDCRGVSMEGHVCTVRWDLWVALPVGIRG